MTKKADNKNADAGLHRVPPHNLEAEQQILGAVLSDNSSLQTVRSMLSADDFYPEAHRLLYHAMCKIAERGEAFDAVLLADSLKQQGKLAKIGGASYLSVLLSNTISSANIIHHCGLVKDKAALRNLLDIAEGIRERVFSANGGGVANILESVKGRLADAQVVKDAGLKFVDAAAWLKEELPAPDSILEGVLDVGDKGALISPSKSMKSLLLAQMAICISVGLSFLCWKVPKPRRVCLIQFEIRDHHFQRRLKRLCQGLEIDGKHLAGRLQILNARGLGLTGPEGVERILRGIIDFQPELICFDPLYKISSGVENAAEDAKIIMSAFDILSEKTGAGIIYTHHDPKGSAGDRSLQDRGAGSNVLGRDFDAGIMLTAHATDENAIVLETLLRNYKPQDPFTIQFIDDEHGGYRFEECPGIVPEKRTSKSKPQKQSVSAYLPIAEIILGNSEAEVSAFKEVFKKQTGMGDHRIREFMGWATSGPNPYLVTRQEGGFGSRKKWVKVGKNLVENDA